MTLLTPHLSQGQRLRRLDGLKRDYCGFVFVLSFLLRPLLLECSISLAKIPIKKITQEFLKRSYPGSDEQRYWVGLTDAVKEGDWRWLDGTRLSETPEYWYHNQPDNWKGKNNQSTEGEDCAETILSQTLYGLFDGFCDVDKKQYVCEAKVPK
ncbi:hypothetical protein NFI96_026675 [Prochilodus magdalenae]|nr:hypothetical protein NFI96_026675 [Prochilodus magdalenae]